MVKDVHRSPAGGGPSFDVSREGTLVFRERSRYGDLVWVNRAGVVEPIGGADQTFLPRLSTDGSRLAFTSVAPSPQASISVLDIGRGVSHRVSRDTLVAAWHPSNETIAIMQVQSQIETIQIVRADGSGEPTPVGTFAGRRTPNAFSPGVDS